MRNINKSTFPPVCTQVVLELQGHSKMQINLSRWFVAQIWLSESSRENRVLHIKMCLNSLFCEVRPLGCQQERSRMMTKRHQWRLIKIHKWPLSEHLTWEKWQMDLRDSLMKHPWNLLMLPQRIDGLSIIRLVSLQQCFFFFFSIDLLGLRLISLGCPKPVSFLYTLTTGAGGCKQSPLLLRRW